MFCDEGFQIGSLFCSLLFSTFCHQNFKNCLKPFLNFSTFKVFDQCLNDYKIRSNIFFVNKKMNLYIVLKEIVLNFYAACTNLKVVSLSFEFSRSINSVSQDLGNGFFNIFHPFHHFGISYAVDFLDERIIFLPKRHFDGSMFSPPPLKIYTR